MKSLSIMAAVLTISLASFHAASAQTGGALEAQATKLREIIREASRLSRDVAQVEIAPPDQGWELGMVSWIAAGDEDLIYLLQRGDRADPVIALDRTGRVVRSWGRGMYATPHSIRVDPDGNVGDPADQVPLFGVYSIKLDFDAVTTTVFFTPSTGMPSAGDNLTSPRRIVVMFSSMIADLGGNQLSNGTDVSFVPEVIDFSPTDRGGSVS